MAARTSWLFAAAAAQMAGRTMKTGYGVPASRKIRLKLCGSFGKNSSFYRKIHTNAIARSPFFWLRCAKDIINLHTALT